MATIDTPLTLTTQQKLNAAKAQQKSNEARLKILKINQSHLKKPDPKNYAAVARYKAQVAAYNAKYKALSANNAALVKTIPTLQNKVYEETGQYDKLLTGTDRDAFLALKTVFEGYGLGTLADKIYNYVKNGESADTISIQLQDSPE